MSTPFLCAQLAQLAYKDVTLNNAKRFGMSWLQVVENGASYAFLCGDRRKVYVVYRGTNDKQDWMWDARFGKTDFPAGGRVHRGFKMAHDKIWPEVKAHLDRLDPRLPVFITGHSLGAAMTQLTAAHLCSTGQAPEQCHTFGGPRVGNEDFTNLITCPGDMWEAHFDPVTGIPFRWGPGQTIFAWWHKRAPSMFLQPPSWAMHTINSWFHSMSGYVPAMKKIS